MKTPTMARRKYSPHVNLQIEINHSVAPYFWEENPGVEFWRLRALLGLEESARAAIATAKFCRIDLQACTDLVFELDCISRDLGEIASAIKDSEELLAEQFAILSGSASILIATDVVVDPFWRGNRLGPALVFFAADTLRADATFLTPVALGTRISDSGECYTDYEARRPGLLAQKKVEAAWRKAGFRKLADAVVWSPISLNRYDLPNRGALARKTITKIEKLASEARASAWLKRRLKNAPNSR